MTDDEAAAMLVALTKHFRQPVQPIDRYCKALTTWADQIGARADRRKQELFPDLYLSYEERKSDPALAARAEAALVAYRAHDDDDLRWKEDMAESVDSTFLQIRKSALLARLLYAGEPLRTRMCPQHKGTWSGLFGDCEHGCQLTGWLPEAGPK